MSAQLGAPEADVIAGGHATPDRPRRRRLVLAGWVVLTLLVAGVLADGWSRDREVAALRARAAALEAATDQATAGLRGVTWFVGPTLGRSDLDPGARDDVLAVVRQAAGAGVDDVTAARDALLAVRVLPWHSDVAAARRAQVEHAEAWRDYFRTGARDLDAMADLQPETLRIRDSARAALAGVGG
ncbi:MAG: hypothetical protein MUC45_01130 [Actinomycetia bacterium]|jgi:hypothetical protein|nr:hypothetical protein [Actinomycetes bacterium]